MRPAAWLSRYRADWLRPDLMAGLTGAAVIAPQAMAYAVIAGLPVQAGLYTALGAMLAYPLLGTSRPLSVSTTSALAMMTAAEIALADPSGASAPAIASTLAFLVGAMFFAAGLLRLGFIANFISKPVLIGFEGGVGLALVVSQLKPMLGIPLTSRTTLGTLAQLPAALPALHPVTAALGVAGVAFLLILSRAWPRVPSSLLWVAAAISASALLGLAARGVELVGKVPAGLPRPALPDLTTASDLWIGALGIALMSFTESVAAANTFIGRDDAPVNSNQELLALGAACAASAFAGGMPAGGGTSQTALIDGAGARSQLAQWAAAAVVAACLLFLSPTVALIPKAALGALIVKAGLGMIHPSKFRAMSIIRKEELIWALTALAGVLVLGTLRGILLAVALSVLTMFYDASRPPIYEVAYNRQKKVFRRVGDHASDETFPGLLLLRAEGRINFVNAPYATEKMRALMRKADPKVVVLECGAIPDIEYTALTELVAAQARLKARGVPLWLANVNPDLLEVLRRSPLGAALGDECMFFNLERVLEAWESKRAEEKHAG